MPQRDLPETDVAAADETAADDSGHSAESGPSFEDELLVLQEAVARLERGELSLEDAIGQFERGFRAYEHCSELLGRARRRIEVLCESSESTDEENGAASLRGRES